MSFSSGIQFRGLFSDFVLTFSGYGHLALNTSGSRPCHPSSGRHTGVHFGMAFADCHPDFAGHYFAYREDPQNLFVSKNKASDFNKAKMSQASGIALRPCSVFAPFITTVDVSCPIFCCNTITGQFTAFLNEAATRRILCRVILYKCYRGSIVLSIGNLCVSNHTNFRPFFMKSRCLQFRGGYWSVTAFRAFPNLLALVLTDLPISKDSQS